MKKTQNPHKNLVIEVHIFLSTFIILQKMLRAFTCVLKCIIDLSSNTHTNK